MSDVMMPRLSDSMEEGTIVRWLKADGEAVERDEELVEIETDKATVTYEAEASGVLSIAVKEGDTVPVGTLIAHLGFVGDAPAAAVAAASSAASGARDAARDAPPAARRGAGGMRSASPSSNGSGALAGVKASPLARRIASRLQVDLALVAGSGYGGRVLKRDVIAAADAGGAAAALASPGPGVAAEAPRPAAAGAPGTAQAETARGGSTTQPLTRTQAVIARRMSESRATIPDFALEVDVDMTEALAARATWKRLSDAPPTLNDIIVKACALSLRRHPKANGSYRDGQFALHERVNVGMAVAVEGALVVPTLFDADSKPLQTISAEARDLVARARERSLTPPELAGGTFTVSNLGMYGIDRFEGVINPPQAAILCVGAIVERPVAREGRIEARAMMTATLACDHRILYGAEAAEFLADIRRLLEQPLAMML